MVTAPEWAGLSGLVGPTPPSHVARTFKTASRSLWVLTRPSQLRRRPPELLDLEPQALPSTRWPFF